MAQKVIVIINAAEDREFSPQVIEDHLTGLGYEVELSEDTLQKSSHPFQPLAFALQDDVSIALENAGYEEPSDRLMDVASRALSDSEDLQEFISNEAANIVGEGFDDEDLEEDEDDEDDNEDD